MKRILLLALTFISFQAFAQLDCLIEDNHSHSLTAVSNALANCTLAHGDDYWMCRALTERNCSIARGDRNYWKCRALTEKNCTLIGNSDDYWMCRGIVDKNCSLSHQDYWFCRGTTELNCTVVPTEKYWMCRALGDTLSR